MDSFFASVATLMSNNLRTLVEKSLDDLSDLFGVYKAGNKFEGTFTRRLPVTPQPIAITVVSADNCIFLTVILRTLVGRKCMKGFLALFRLELLP